MHAEIAQDNADTSASIKYDCCDIFERSTSTYKSERRNVIVICNNVNLIMSGEIIQGERRYINMLRVVLNVSPRRFSL